MFEITATSASPYSSVCYIQCDWADGTSTRASGVVVGVNDVLTALHVVFDATRGGWAQQVTIVPGADTVPFREPFGEFYDVGMLSGRAPNWDLDGDQLLTPQESAGDFALLGMSSPIGEVTGWLPVAQMPADFYGLMTGYPARGSGLMGESVFADASDTVGVYDIGSGLGAGASGGPLLYSSGGVTSVVGVLSSGNYADTHSTYAGLFPADTWNWLTSAMAANDVLLGSLAASLPLSSPNVLLGTAGADTFIGTAGRDSFTGKAGDDSFDGAGGTDTSTYVGARADYTVTVLSPGELQVRDQFTLRSGTDTLHNVERLSFDDLSLAFDVLGSAGEAYRLYQAAFNRAPDLPGLGFQMAALDNGLLLVQVADNFLHSPEFLRTYGALDDGQFVTQLYANVLHRAPDEGGFAYHTDHLAHGFTRADVIVGFSESPENMANVIGVIQDGMAYTL